MEDGPEIDIAVVPVSEDVPDCEACLREVIETTLRRHHKSSARISVALVNDARMAHLNKAYLGRDEPTDVLAFNLTDAPRDREVSVQGPGGHHGMAVEGEIVVSVETATREARQRGHSTTAELALYTLHGMLHLLGYDDQQEEAAARMHELEDDILSTVGLGTVYRSDAQ